MDILLAIGYVHDISHPQIHYHRVRGWQIAIQIYSPEKETQALNSIERCLAKALDPIVIKK